MAPENWSNQQKESSMIPSSAAFSPSVCTGSSLQGQTFDKLYFSHILQANLSETAVATKRTVAQSHVFI